MPFSRFPRMRFAHLPTPLEQLDRFSEMLGGPRILIKRDDCTGLAFGGNKARKLEFLIADAVENGADTVITAGGLQSNHVRQTAAAANKAGLACHLVLQRYVDWKDRAYLESGNLLLDSMLGATVHFCAPDASRDDEMRRLGQSLSADGASPYIIPGGGANRIGGLGYAYAAGELLVQAKEMLIDIGYVVLPSSSGSSQGGLIAGFKLQSSDVQVLGIDVDVPGLGVAQQVAAIARGTCELLGLDGEGAAELVHVVDGYGGDGYGYPTDKMIEACQLMATLEGVVLDPVYSGKAMAGLIDMIRRGELRSDRAVVFIHTGGLPGVFAYPSLFPRVAPEHI